MEEPGKFYTNFGLQLLHVRRFDLLSLLLDELAWRRSSKFGWQFRSLKQGISCPLSSNFDGSLLAIAFTASGVFVIEAFEDTVAIPHLV